MAALRWSIDIAKLADSTITEFGFQKIICFIGNVAQAD